MFTKMTKQEIDQTLILSAWVQLAPEQALTEINKTMISAGIIEKYFVLRTLTPIYRPKRERLTDPDYWAQKKWDIDSHIKSEKKLNKEFAKQINRLKFKQVYNRALEDFSDDEGDALEVESFLQELCMDYPNLDDQLVICGKLWMRELFLQVQVNSPQIKYARVLVFATFTSSSYLVGLLGTEYYFDEVPEERPQNFWTYQICTIIGVWLYQVTTGLFMYFSYKDAARRKKFMQYFSSMLKIEITDKDQETVRIPTVDFLDQKTLQSWLEARKLIFRLGERFFLRLQYYTSFFIMASIASQIFGFCVLANLISTDIMSVAGWISFTCNIVPLNIIVLIILIPSAYINEEIRSQVKSLMRVREVFQRIVRDEEILRDNPTYITNRIQQLAIQKLRATTKELKGEQRWQVMREKANRIYEALSSAIDEVERESVFNPDQFLGIALYPGSLFTYATFIGTLLFAFLESKIPD